MVPTRGRQSPSAALDRAIPRGGALTYLWQFGDGTKSTAANPSKKYQDSGQFDVRSIVKDPTGLAHTAEIAAAAANVAPRRPAADRSRREVMQRSTRIYAASAVTVALTVYLVAIVFGLIAPENRLSPTELGLVIVSAVVVGVLRTPELLSRLTSRARGEPDPAVLDLRQTQELQQRELNHVRFLLRYLLSVEEHTHLQALREGKGDGYRMWQPLRIELIKLRRLGMIKPVQGRQIEHLPEKTIFNLADYFELTPGGLEYVRGTEASSVHPIHRSARHSAGMRARRSPEAAGEE
jgi:hypothetical protein